MTTYGTIPTTSSSSSPPPNLEYISRAKEYIKASLSSCQSWKLMFNINSINKLPTNVREAITRIKFNLTYFRMNYTLIILLVLFFSLLWHPISLIVFILMMVAWLALYFLRDEPLRIFDRTVDDREVMILLSVLTLVFLFLIGDDDVTVNILVALLIGGVIVCVHAMLRKIDDLFLDEESAAALMTPPPPSPPAAAAAVASSSSSS